MTPYQQIRDLYFRRPEKLTFDEYLSWHLLNGFVHSTPAFFIMGLPVRKVEMEAGLRDLDLLLMQFSGESADAWYVSAMAGDLTKAWDMLPYELPWIGWERDVGPEKVLSFHPAARIKRLCQVPAE